jgi:CRP/FNR family transcriptional regulator, cyclic AMP receptor protein
MIPAVDLAAVGVQNPVWLAIGDETRSKLQARGSVRAFEGGELLLQEGQPAGIAFIPLKGKLQLSKTGRGGRRQVLCKLDPTKCGGPCLLMMGDQSLGDMRSLESGLVLLLSRDEMEALAIQDPELGRVVLRAVVRCMTHFVGAMENLSFNKVAQRVALALLDSTSANGGMVRQTQAELAAEVGTTREVVARCLADLQEAGVIKLGRGRISVLDRQQLQQSY